MFGDSAFAEEPFGAAKSAAAVILSAYLTLAIIETYRDLEVLKMPRAGQTASFTLRVNNTDGPEDISGLTKLEVVLIDREGTTNTLISTNPAGQDETISMSNADNGEITITPVSDTFDEDLGDYYAYAKLYTDATTFSTAPVNGEVHIPLSRNFGA